MRDDDFGWMRGGGLGDVPAKAEWCNEDLTGFLIELRSRCGTEQLGSKVRHVTEGWVSRARDFAPANTVADTPPLRNPSYVAWGTEWVGLTRDGGLFFYIADAYKLCILARVMDSRGRLFNGESDVWSAASNLPGDVTSIRSTGDLAWIAAFDCAAAASCNTVMPCDIAPECLFPLAREVSTPMRIVGGYPLFWLCRTEILTKTLGLLGIGFGGFFRFSHTLANNGTAGEETQRRGHRAQQNILLMVKTETKGEWSRWIWKAISGRGPSFTPHFGLNTIYSKRNTLCKRELGPRFSLEEDRVLEVGICARDIRFGKDEAPRTSTTCESDFGNGVGEAEKNNGWSAGAHGAEISSARRVVYITVARVALQIASAKKMKGARKDTHQGNRQPAKFAAGMHSPQKREV
ncbi:hypothetical protein B0H10DRAFT_1967789 [Mycena sp. CBHHK59/15]|nr:hypothetical protein B0H10DRAFT_1967789 [Mycena sp. CBHHK59/15]